MYPYIEFPVKDIDSFDSFVDYAEANGIKISAFAQETRTSLPQNKIESVVYDGNMKFGNNMYEFSFEHIHLPKESLTLQFHADEYSKMSNENVQTLKDLFPAKFDETFPEKKQGKCFKKIKANEFVFEVTDLSSYDNRASTFICSWIFRGCWI